MSNLVVRANCVIFGIDLIKKQKHVFSLSEQEMVLPFILIDSDNKHCIIESLCSSLSKYFPESELNLNNPESVPQIISAHSEDIIADNENVLNMVYGFLTDYDQSLVDGYWISFDYLSVTKYHNLFFEVIRNIK